MQVRVFCVPLSGLSARVICNVLLVSLAGFALWSDVIRSLVDWWATVEDDAEASVYIGGMTCVASGRLTGQPRAESEVVSFGGSSFRRFDRFISFCKRQVVLKYGVVGLKVWMWRKK